MTDETLTQLSAYLGHIADSIGLKDWTFDVFGDAEIEDAYAECDFANGRKHAKIRFVKGFEDQPAGVIRTTVVHELIHCHFAQVEQTADNAQEYLGKVGDLWREDFMTALEFGVDAVAVALAERLPEIGWPEAELREIL